MSSAIFVSTIARQLQKTLSLIVDDKRDGIEAAAQYKKYYSVDSMDGAYRDELEMATSGVAQEVPEGTDVPTGTVKEGVFTRYYARKYGLILRISEEAMADKKYPESIDLARRLKRALWKTVDIEAALGLARAFSASYPGADGVSLCSASHPLPHGGTYSNLLATAMSPGRVAISQILTMARTMVGHDGFREGYNVKKIICPVDQLPAWEILVKSTKDPTPGEFNAVNITNLHFGIEDVIGVLQWTSSTTNWFVTTDAPDAGLRFYWRERPWSGTEVENVPGVMLYYTKARWGRGWTDARGIIGVNA